MGFLSGLLDNLYNKLSEPQSLESDKGNSNIMSFSVGFNNPALNFRSYGLNADNSQKVQSKISDITNKQPFKIEQIKTSNYNSFRSVRKSLMQINPLEQTNYRPFYNFNLDHASGIRYENIFKPTAEVFANFNNYRFIYNTPIKTLAGFKKDEADGIVKLYNDSTVSPSLFNPMFMVLSKGITPNTPLLNTSASPGRYDTSDCSIKELVSQSYRTNSILGLARYRYTDFMYCRDLGKIPNNRLITLRKFAYPVGDNIFEHYDDGAADIGRLVTWFGNDENKLEDILNYSYKASWKELSAKIEEIQSKEDDSTNAARGPVGMILNSLNPSYNGSIGGGFAGGGIFGFLGASGPKEDRSEILRMYDKNKVYTPKNTIQDTHTYEGKLTFTHEFTIVFTYKLRAYDNINPRSAFLDLIGNILNVTYRRGKFWGGDRRFIGPPQNTQGWKKANAMIDGAWDKAGSTLAGLATGTLKLGDIFGAISGFVSKFFEGAKNAVKNIVEDPQGAGQKIMKTTYDWAKKVGLDKAAMGHLKNELGRPALYAMDSLLTGDNVGLWHVTIGNPKNPIAAMGNLILENASVQHYGPLGIDDFPTELKVTVTLKHARSRDSVEIGRMYTKGTNGIYLVSHGTNINSWYPSYGLGDSGSSNQSQHNATIDENGQVQLKEPNKWYDGQVTSDPSDPDNREKEYKYLSELYTKNPPVPDGIKINSGLAAKMDHYNQLLMYDLAILTDEIA